MTIESTLCYQCHEDSGAPRVIDFPESPFARCETCGYNDDGDGLVAIEGA